MGKFVVVIGTQWGDEGKGKVVDLLTERAAAVARFQGGHNAGHTLVIGGQKTVLSLLPSASCASRCVASSATASCCLSRRCLPRVRRSSTRACRCSIACAFHPTAR